MDERDSRVWARVDPLMRERIRVEARLLFEGNESMLVRKAIMRFLDELDTRREQPANDALGDLVSAA
jgi:hypothetical protein